MLPAAAKYNAAAPTQRKQKAAVRQTSADQYLYADGESVSVALLLHALHACQFTLNSWVCEQIHTYPIFAHWHVPLLTQHELTATEPQPVLHCSGQCRSGTSDAAVIQQTQPNAIICTASRAVAGEAAYHTVVQP